MSPIDNEKTYQSDYQFLLIGKNPLPNYVAAKLLIKQGAKVYFVYSEGEETGTEGYKKRLVSKLKAQLGNEFFTPIDVPLSDSADSLKIKKAIANQIASIPKDSVIGLNYTGGTKAMSVHCYRAIEECAKDKNCTLQFSYLDPRELKLRFDAWKDGDGNYSIDLHEAKTEFFNKTKVALGDLVYLHGQEYRQRENKNPRGSVRWKDANCNLSSTIFQDCIDNEGWIKFRQQKIQWKLLEEGAKSVGYKYFTKRNQDKFEKFLRRQKLKLEFEVKVQGNKWESREIKKIENVKNALKNFGLLKNDEIILANLPNDESAEEFCNFLAGTWLEDYVLDKVLDLEKECDLGKSGSSFEIALPKKPNSPFYEIDVVTMRGYQLFAVACTVDFDVKRCKQKIFEVLLRARQLGGDEAKVALVCLASQNYYDVNYVEILENELKDTHVKVFGKENLRNLENDLRKWFIEG